MLRVDDGSKVVIWPEGESVIYDKVAFQSSFCGESDGYYCFVSELLEFAVPKHFEDQNEWEYNGSLYCVQRRIQADFLPGDGSGRAFLIYSGGGKDCSSSESFSKSFIYSPEFGLRYYKNVESPRGMEILFALNEFGFGSNCATAE